MENPSNVEGTEKICRICFETDECLLISACKCAGSLKYTHESCLEMWIKMKYEKITHAQCEICRHSYKFVMETKKYWEKNIDEEKKCKFQFNITILIFFFSVLGIVSIIAGVFYIDLKEKFVYSLLILLSLVIPGFILLWLIVKLIISNYVGTQITHWKIRPLSK